MFLTVKHFPRFDHQRSLEKQMLMQYTHSVGVTRNCEKHDGQLKFKDPRS